MCVCVCEGCCLVGSVVGWAGFASACPPVWLSVVFLSARACTHTGYVHIVYSLCGLSLGSRLCMVSIIRRSFVSHHSGAVLCVASFDCKRGTLTRS